MHRTITASPCWVALSIPTTGHYWAVHFSSIKHCPLTTADLESVPPSNKWLLLSTSRTASQLVRPLLQGSRSLHVQTKIRYPVCSNKPHLARPAMRPSNEEQMNNSFWIENCALQKWVCVCVCDVLCVKLVPHSHCVAQCSERTGKLSLLQFAVSIHSTLQMTCESRFTPKL